MSKMDVRLHMSDALWCFYLVFVSLNMFLSEPCKLSLENKKQNTEDKAKRIEESHHEFWEKVVDGSLCNNFKNKSMHSSTFILIG